MATQAELLQGAQEWAAELARRPGVVGLFLYGSLTDDPAELTPFSDIDVCLVLDDATLPAHFAEHRLWNGIKTDTTLLAASVLRRWTTDPPQRLFGGHWVESLFLRGLTLGGPDAVLFDPTGAVAAAQAALPSYDTLAQPELGRWLDDYAQNQLPRIEAALQSGDLGAALEGFHSGWLSGIAEFAAHTKRRAVAAERLGIPALATLLDAQAAALPDVPEASAAYCATGAALAAFSEERLLDPVQTALRQQGVADPGAVELRGEWRVFWGGNRVHTIERIAYDHSVSVRWSQFYQERGSGEDACNILWPFTSTLIRDRATDLGAALTALGFDVTATVTDFLEHPQLLAREKAFTDAEAARQTARYARADFATALACAREAHALLTRTLGS